MADIEVKATDQGDTYECQVTVSERGSETRHRVFSWSANQRNRSYVPLI
jgi:hypothetical protein